MALPISDSTFNTLKKGSEALGTLNTANKLLIELFDPQFKNVFEVILYPADLTSNVSPTSIGTTALDAIITRLYLQSISPSFKEIEYGDADITKFIKGLIRPTTVTITFIENEQGTVRSYLKSWLEEIVVEDPLFGYRFKDNQMASKKNAIIMLQQGFGLPSLPWVRLEGLKYQSQESQTFGHGETEPMIIGATFSVDNVKWSTF
jgi:hypothetical protein